MPNAEEIRDAQRATWAGLSGGWEKWDLVIMDQLGPVGAAIVGRLDLAEDQQHLDIAPGTGEPGLTIARLVPKGRVVLTDIAPEMLDVAAHRSSRYPVGAVSACDVPTGSCVDESNRPASASGRRSSELGQVSRIGTASVNLGGHTGGDAMSKRGAAKVDEPCRLVEPHRAASDQGRRRGPRVRRLTR